MTREKFSMGHSVLLAMQMALRVAEIHCGRQLNWQFVNIDAFATASDDPGKETRKVAFTAAFDFIREAGGYFSPTLIICDLEYQNLMHWMPTRVEVQVPSGTTRYVYIAVEPGKTFASTTWKIEREV